MEELRLPKCLTEEERRGILKYNEDILQNNFAPNEREGMSKEIYVLRDDRGIFCPYSEYSPWISVLSLSFEEDTTNKALHNALLNVLRQTQEGCEYGDIALFFNRAYAIATHVLNNSDSVYTLKSYLKIWDNHYDTTVLSLHGLRFSQLNSELCKHICACMVHCILAYEKDPHLQPLLQEIEWRLQASKKGINMDTLKVFQEAVATANEQTEENTQGEEQPKADTPLEKEEQTAPTDATKDVFFKNTALLKFREEGGIEKWASLVKEAVKDIEDHTLNSRLDNTMFAVMYYFASGWRKRKGIFINKPNVKQIVYFFLSRCAFQTKDVRGKTLDNKLNELLKGDKKIKETDETEQVRKKIQKIIEKNS